MTERRNDAGEPLGTARVRLKQAEYGTGEYHGYFPAIRWEAYRQDCANADGFDLRHREENGDYLMEVTLLKGTLLLRYGSERGHFTAPLHTPYETLGLPYVRETVEYHEYRVVADGLRVLCLVRRGRVAPMFDSPGGGVQAPGQHPGTDAKKARFGGGCGMSKVHILVPTREQNILRVMERVLRSNGIFPEQYSVGGYAEECVCLERTDDGWEVYDGERGQHYAAFTSPNLRAACLQMLDRLAESDVQSQTMQNAFRRLLRAESGERKKPTQALRVLRTGGARLKVMERLSGLYPVLRAYASKREQEETNTAEPPMIAGKVSEV